MIEIIDEVFGQLEDSHKGIHEAVELLKTACDRVKGLQFELNEVKKAKEGYIKALDKCALELKEALEDKEKHRIMSGQHQRLYAIEQETNRKLRDEIVTLKKRIPSHPSEDYERLYKETAVENEKLLKALRGDMNKVRTTVLISELARRVDLIEGEL